MRSPRVRPPCRPRLSVEPLEDRLAPATFLVENADNAGIGSLRRAINMANATPGADRIEFAIGSGPQTINLASALPTITEPLTIAGQTQPGFAGAPLIELNGAAAGHGASGLALSAGASGTVVRGLVINNFNGDGIRVWANNCRIVGNFIGTDASGTADFGNAGNGVGLQTGVSGNLIGGTAPSARNVISGNGNSGVLITGLGNLVQGNYIGTDATGTAALGNGESGVFVGAGGAGGATGNVIGGTTPGTRNIISGSGSHGVWLTGFDATGNVVQGNFIGTDATGTVALGNGDGVFISYAASNNVVGGTSAAARNVISGNGGPGVELYFAGTSGNRVQGNRIGVAANGSALGNGGDGVLVTSGAGSNRIGGTAPGAGNVIANNGASGVRVESGIRNAILGNRIFDNAELGIDVGPAGVTPNDVDDPDIGANRLLNFPLLYLARETFVYSSVPHTPPVLVLRVRGSINTEMNRTLRIEFFASPAADPSGNGEGAKFLGASTVTTGSSNTVSFNLLLPLAGDLQGQVVTATVTDDLGNTSEFSAALNVSL